MENFKKTSVNINTELAGKYKNSGSLIKKAVLNVNPASTQKNELTQICSKLKVKSDDELENILFQNLATRKKMKNIKIHLSEVDKGIINHLSQKNNFSEKFRQLLLLHYAQNIDLEKLNNQINAHYLQTVIPFVRTPEKPEHPSDTGIYVHGNKQWFLTEFRKILTALPDEITTAIDSFAGSGCITYELYKHKRFNRIIANDITWQKSNYIKALFKNTKELKNACLSLTPDKSTYDKAKEIAKNNPEPLHDIKTDDANTIDFESAALYHLKSYYETSRGQLKKEVQGKNAIEQYQRSLSYLWNVPASAKNVIVHHMDGGEIIKHYRRKKHMLFVDTPYIYTKGYEKNFPIAAFDEIVRETLKFTGKFIFCCRITKKHTQAKNLLDIQYSTEDMRIKGKIDSLFYGHALYYIDFLYKKSGIAIERVITNFPFAGCYHYDTGQPCQGK